MNIIKIINSVPVIEELMSQKLKFATSFKLKKIAEEVNIVAKQFEEKRKELLDEFATLNDEGTEYSFKEGSDNIDKFNAAMSVYVDDGEIDLDFKPITLSELENVEIEAAKLNYIDWFIVNK